MNCPKCGAENRKEALFCGDCGYQIKNLTSKQRWALFVLVCLLIFTISYIPLLIYFNFVNSLEQGESALKSKKFEEALDFCKKAVNLKPENEKAKACLKDATENLINSFISIGKELMSAGKYEQASEYFQKALNLGGGTNVKKLLDTAKAKIEVKNRAKTEAINKGRELMSTGKYEEALKYFQKALNLGGGAEVKKLLDTAKTKIKAEAKAEAINRAINGSYKEMNWDDAFKYCKELGLRLPTVNELERIYESECITIKKRVSCDRWFWSTEEYVLNTKLAMIVSFVDGNVDNTFKSHTLYVRCVR